MKISYDAQVDALSIVFRDTSVTTKHLAEGIAADYDSEDRLVGLEILDAVRRFGGQETLRQVVLEGIGPSVRGSCELPGFIVVQTDDCTTNLLRCGPCPSSGGRGCTGVGSAWANELPILVYWSVDSLWSLAVAGDVRAGGWVATHPPAAATR
jgi:uncharacterized protein YuzE